MKETDETGSEKHRQAEGALAAGAAEVEITPAPGVHMAGDMCRLRPVEQILDPLFARAIVFSNPGETDAARVCLLSLDLCTVGDDAADDIRERVSEKFGFCKEEVTTSELFTNFFQRNLSVLVLTLSEHFGNFRGCQIKQPCSMTCPT